MTRPSKPWTTRPWPTAHWTENTLEGRGTMLDPQETISHLIAWTAVALISAAAVAAGGLLAAAKWVGGDRAGTHARG